MLVLVWNVGMTGLLEKNDVFGGLLNVMLINQITNPEDKEIFLNFMKQFVKKKKWEINNVRSLVTKTR